MNYWILTTEFPPFHGGGISTYNLHTGLMLIEKGHTVSVFVPDHNLQNILERSVFEGINVIRFKPGNESYYNYLGYSSALSFQFSELVLSELEIGDRPDYIETQDYHGIGYYLILKKKLGDSQLTNIPIILTAHAPSFYYLECNQAPVFSLPEFWVGEMEKWTMQAADILISPSQYLVDNVEEHLNGAGDNYHVVRNPYKNLVKKNATITFKDEDIVFFGKLTYQKGCLQLLKCMSALWDKGLSNKISFIGDDHYFEPKQSSMREYITKKYQRYFDKGFFSFEGKMNLEQLDQRLSKASLIIVPSVVDNFPYAVVESMLMKKVLLISDGGGQREMIEDGKSGFIYQSDNLDSFVNKFKEILKLSETELKLIGENAYTRITSLCNYEAIYKNKMGILSAYKHSTSSVFPFVHELPKADYKLISHGDSAKLSIVVPYYNTGKYIKETIENIFEVNYENKEVIIINDGSDDAESIEALEDIQLNFPVRIVSQSNQGLASARNTGIREAKGEFVAFLDADDKIDPNFYSRAIDILNNYNNLSFVSSWVIYFDGSQGIWPAQNPEPPFYLLQNMVNAGFLCRKIDYLNFAINDLMFEYGMEDYDANLSLLENGCRGVVIPEPLYQYRIHASSMARGFNKFNRLYLYRLLSKKHKGLYEKFSYEIFNLLMANGPSYLYDNPTWKPATDIHEYKQRIKDLEDATSWYDRTLKHYEQVLNEQKVDEKITTQVPEFEVVSTVLDNNYLNENYQIIKDWYHKEYEVLPLWYKRFGHVIKAFQGKRSFKSLLKKEHQN